MNAAHKAVFVAGVLLIASTQSCTSDIVGPGTAVRGTLHGSAAKEFRSEDGTIYSIDRSRGSLRSSKGKEMRLSPVRLARLEEVFDQVVIMDTLIAATEKKIGLRYVGRVRRKENRKIAIVNSSRLSRLAPPVSASNYLELLEGLDNHNASCLDISQNILKQTALWHADKEILAFALDQLIGMSAEDLSGALGGTVYAVIDLMETLLLDSTVELTWLAAMYSSPAFACESNNWVGFHYGTQARFVDVGEGVSGGGMLLPGCTLEWGKVEQSWDGGQTWQTVWEGNYTSCLM